MHTGHLDRIFVLLATAAAFLTTTMHVASAADETPPSFSTPGTSGAPVIPERASGPTEDPVAEDRGDLEDLDLASLLENVVVTATKSELKEDDAPAITTVISREEIRRWGYQSVAEVLGHVAGVYIIDDHSIANMGIRGVSGGLRSESGLVKVMIDGRSVAFRSSAGNWIGPELVPLSAIQQIEIIRGPASALYGADAFLGVVNIVTRHPDQVEGGEIGFSGNSQGGSVGLGQDLTAAGTVGNWQFLASYRASQEDRSGLILPRSSPAPTLPSYAPSDRVAHGLTLGSQVALGTLSYRMGQRASVSLTGYFSGIDRGAEFADWAQLTHNQDDQGRSNGTLVSLRHGFVNLGVDWRPRSVLDLSLTSSLFAGGPTDRDRIETGSDVFYVRRDFGYRGFDVEAEARWRPVKTVTALLGAGTISDEEKRPVIYHVTKTTLGDLGPGDQQQVSGAMGRIILWNPGVHGSIWLTPWQGLNLIAGARYDYHNIYGGRPSARLGGVVALSSRLHFKLLYGSAFKAPSPQLLWGSPLAVGDITGNSQLKPSYVHTVEGQLVYRPTAFFVVTTGLAYSYLIDQAEFAPVGVNQVARNISQVESVSWESELKLDWRKKVAAYANLSLTRANHRLENPGYVATLTKYPNNAYPLAVARAGTSAAVPRLPLRISVEGSYVSARSSSGANTLDAGRVYYLAPYFLLGASVRTTNLEFFSQRETSVALTVRNLLGAYIVDPGFAGVDYPQVGRTVTLQVVQQL
jgi:outer membrane receptor for ferrienterochelin and colicins